MSAIAEPSVTGGVRLPGGRVLGRREAEDYLALLQEQHRRHAARRLQTERAEILQRCQTLHGFIEEFWYVLEPVARFKSGWALEAMCAHLEAVTRGDIKRLLMTVPPGMMKSLLLVFWTAWEWGPKDMPHIQVLATSYSERNVHRDNMKLRDLVKSEKFQALWPLAIRSDQDAKGKFINVKSGFSEGRPFAKMTGGRANRVKIDDPHDTEQAESDVERAKAVRIMQEAISDRLNDPANDAIVLIMQRLHFKDCAAKAIELGYVHLNLPMEFETEKVDTQGKKNGGPCRTVLRPANDGNPAIIFEDPRIQEGELLFPERFPPDTVAQLKKAKGSYAWAGQYQQRPAPRDGGIFKRAWFEIVDAIPNSCTSRVRAWDLAGTEGGGDYTVGLRITRDAYTGTFYVERVLRDQLSPGGVAALVRQTADLDGLQTRIRIPQDPAQAGKAQAQTYITLLAGYTVLAVAPTGDKVTRANPAAIQAEAGNVKLLRGDWNEAFLDEVCTFPAGAHDDQVDAFADGLNELALGDGFDLATYVKAYG